MTSLQQKRMILIISLLVGMGAATALILFALSQNINLFYSPSQMVTENPKKNKTLRVGGMVVKGSVVRHQGLAVEFVITDYQSNLKIHYAGILPDLFREGQGIVALGQLTEQGEFKASQVLAKHDEKYMPPEVKATLKAGKS
ncbi:MAG: cytochrome c maturation protein CcmE [Candidatus Berkiellales bacterium]